ncbi:MAG: YczE/YyaS/YitT family protein, partial [Thermoleophilaceae bacterium]
RASLWRPSAAQLARLLPGLWIFGTGEACIVHARLGNSPWTVLAEGVSKHTSLSIGDATIAISFAVLLAWIPLRQRPGLGTLLNAVVIGLALDTMLGVLPGPGGVVPRLAFVLAGIALVSIGSGLYLTARLGPGPRDGLMTGLHFRTGRSLRLIRGLLEGGALTAGFVLGGRVGVGTVAFALLIGPGVQAAVTTLGGRLR